MAQQARAAGQRSLERKPNLKVVRKGQEQETQVAPADPKLKGVDGNPYFSPANIDRLITMAEGLITEGSVELSTKEQNYKETEALWLETKSDYDKSMAKVEEGKEILESLSRYRNKIKPKEEIRVMRTTSHAAKPPRKPQETRIPWKTLAVASLERLDRFVTTEQLFDIVLQENPEVAKLIGDGPKLGRMKGATVVNWRVDGQNPKVKAEKDLLVWYKDKLGLTKWVDKDRRPTGNYLRHFMQG